MPSAPSSPEDGGNFRRSLQIDMKGLVGDAVGNMSISPASRDVVLAARRGLFIIDLEAPLEVPRFLPQGGTWDVADVQWNPHPSRAEYIVSTSSEKLLIWNLLIVGKTSIEHILHSHYRAITDINWHTTECDTVASTGIDSWIWTWDLREPRKPIFVGLSAFNESGTQVKWNRQDPNILASSHANEVLIWDRRKGSLPMVSIRAHDSKIYGIDWSHSIRDEIVTCSLDHTIKVWDVNASPATTSSFRDLHSPSLGSSLQSFTLYPSDVDVGSIVCLQSLSASGTGKSRHTPMAPKTTIRTVYPVWRARNLPFAQGVLSLAQRGETALEMYRTDSPFSGGGPKEKTPTNIHATSHVPVEVFEGHKDVVKEFVWRKGGQEATEYQLITWSKDRTLRFWPMDQETMQKVGHTYSPPRGRARYPTINDQNISFRNPPEGTEYHPALSAPIGHRSILAEVRAAPPRTRRGDLGSAHRASLHERFAAAKGSNGSTALLSAPGVDDYISASTNGSTLETTGSGSGPIGMPPSAMRRSEEKSKDPEKEKGRSRRSSSLSRTGTDDKKEDSSQSLQDEITSVLNKLSSAKIKLEKACARHNIDPPPMDSESSDDDEHMTRQSRDFTVSLLRNNKNLAEPRTSQGTFGPNGVKHIEGAGGGDILRIMTNLLTVSHNNKHFFDFKLQGDIPKNYRPQIPTRRSTIYIARTNDIAGPDRKVATSYVFSGDNLAAVCDRNAQVAQEYGSTSINHNVLMQIYAELAKEKDLQMLAMLAVLLLQAGEYIETSNEKGKQKSKSLARSPLSPLITSLTSFDYFSLARSINNGSSPALLPWPRVASPSVQTTPTQTRSSWSSIFNAGTMRQLMSGSHDTLKENSPPQPGTPTVNSSEGGIPVPSVNRPPRTPDPPRRITRHNSIVKSPSAISKSWNESLSASTKPGAVSPSPPYPSSKVHPKRSSGEKRLVFTQEPNSNVPTVNPLQEPRFVGQLLTHIHVYAELLFAWQLYHRRLELLKCVRSNLHDKACQDFNSGRRVNMSQYTSSSPPPLRHPIPTHPAYIPDPPSTPSSPQGYQRFSSSPAPASQPAQYPTHVPAYTTPFQHNYNPGHDQIHGANMHGMPPNPPPQAQGMMPPPDFGAWGMNDATAQFSMQLGQSAVAAGQDYVQRNFGGIFPTTYIKHHFNVSNSYVINKLRIILFPWRHKPWARRVRRSEQGTSEWQPAREDINSPDLYIPVMALVTYVLISALHSGLQKRFHPQVLGESASRAIAVVILDFLFVKTGCYILNVQESSQVVDLIAYGGYKFVGVIVTIAAGFLGLNSTLWGVIFVYCFLANAFFLLRSLRSVVIPDSASSAAPTTVNPAQRRRRITFLFLEAVCQVVYMGFLVRV
ncbi:hypothetical protein EYR40_001819 [Pleurotus pulmonarius]|nr:hypothetical protein EYR40_001819 [Pleurotus pulmonarius]